jgi:hypothetical protein
MMMMIMTMIIIIIIIVIILFFIYLLTAQRPINNSIQFFIIYVPSQQLQGQLKTQHNVDTGNYIMDKHNIKPKINYRKVLEESTLMEKVNKQTTKQTKMRGNKNYIAQNISIVNK